jgi:hypothetical protein
MVTNICHAWIVLHQNAIFYYIEQIMKRQLKQWLWLYGRFTTTCAISAWKNLRQRLDISFIPYKLIFAVHLSKWGGLDIITGFSWSFVIVFNNMETFVTVISASTGRNDFIFDIWLWHGDLYRVSPFQVYRTSTSCLPCDLQMNKWGYS